MFNILKSLFKKKSANAILGERAEAFACKYIKKHTPYKILLKNFRCAKHEVDILAFDKESNCLLIIEVKARRDTALVSGYIAALKPSKIRSVVNCKREYMKISPHKFDNFSYNIFEVQHNEKGEITEHFFHENIPLHR